MGIPWLNKLIEGFYSRVSIYYWKHWCWSWSSNSLATWCKGPTHWKRLWCRERLRARGEREDIGCDGWMASLTLWTWVWANSGRVWQFMGSWRVRHDLATEQQSRRKEINIFQWFVKQEIHNRQTWKWGIICHLILIYIN